MRMHHKLKVPPQSAMSIIFPFIRDEKVDGPLKCKECGLSSWSQTYAGYCKMCFNMWCEEMGHKECQIIP